MKRKIILFTIFASISVSCIPASAVTYSDSRVSPSSNYSNEKPSPVVLNYNRNNNYSPQVFMPQSYNKDYGPGSYQSTLPSTPYNITSANVSPTTTNYGQSTGISYDLNIGSVYGTASERGDLVKCIKDMPLTKIGIGRTVSELTSSFTNSSDDSNYWSYDSNSSDNIIFRCGNYIVTFETYKASYGIDVYAKVTSVGQVNYNLNEGEISNFFAGISNKLYEKEQKEKEEEEAHKKAESSNQYSNGTYNNSVIVNGTNSGSIVYNNYN
ncbi:MAG: hypothetical protein Q4F66_07225 [Clostridium sp.]|nr:hypothetical protein [Clostridium sp.]